MPGIPAPRRPRSHEPAPALQHRLSGGDPRTLGNVAEVVGNVLTEPRRLDDLIGCVLNSDDEIVRMRAGDALEKVCRAQPALLQPHVSLLLGELARVDQRSVQWHVAQMLGRVRLTAGQRSRAAELMSRNCEESTDWIVLNCSLDTLAILARQDPSLVAALRRALRRHEQSSLKSLANRARRLRLEFGPDDPAPAAPAGQGKDGRDGQPAR
jgi:hypothetical protein